MRELREALETLKKNSVELEVPGDEIGPTSPGSPHMGLWFHDPDGYRSELCARNCASIDRGVEVRPGIYRTDWAHPPGVSCKGNSIYANDGTSG